MKTTKRILITGGSGMIGRRLTAVLLQEGYDVAHLGRSKRNSAIETYLWDPYKKQIERGALNNVGAIIHLAGAGIADKRWNEKWKKEILASRTETTRFLKETLEREPNNVTAFISSSGINYYGLEDRGRALLNQIGQEMISWPGSLLNGKRKQIRSRVRGGVL